MLVVCSDGTEQDLRPWKRRLAENGTCGNTCSRDFYVYIIDISLLQSQILLLRAAIMTRHKCKGQNAAGFTVTSILVTTEQTWASSIQLHDFRFIFRQLMESLTLMV